MQIILVAAAIASILIGEIATGAAVLLITALNALGGLRQAGQGRERDERAPVDAEADRSGAPRRHRGRGRRRPSRSSGDVVLLAAGDDVAADGRIIEASSLEIDESALTGESVPASKSSALADGTTSGLGDQTEHGVHEHPGDPRQRE
jgi:Ca2+-transporting ATPase